MTSTTATLPSEVQYLDADTYTGRQTIRRTNARIGWGTATELALHHGTGTVFVLWEFSGHVDGRKLFVRTRFLACEDGSLRGYDATGRHIITHPAVRVVNYLAAS